MLSDQGSGAACGLSAVELEPNPGFVSWAPSDAAAHKRLTAMIDYPPRCGRDASVDTSTPLSCIGSL